MMVTIVMEISDLVGAYTRIVLGYINNRDLLTNMRMFLLLGAELLGRYRVHLLTQRSKNLPTI